MEGSGRKGPGGTYCSTLRLKLVNQVGCQQEFVLRRRPRRGARNRVSQAAAIGVAVLGVVPAELQAGQHIPVQVPQIVPFRVFAVVGELDGNPLLPGQPPPPNPDLWLRPCKYRTHIQVEKHKIHIFLNVKGQ